MSEKEASAIGRRDFFRKASLGAGAAGVAAVGLTATQSEASSPDPKAAAGYRETEHVKKVYELSRF